MTDATTRKKNAERQAAYRARRKAEREHNQPTEDIHPENIDYVLTIAGQKTDAVEQRCNERLTELINTLNEWLTALDRENHDLRARISALEKAADKRAPKKTDKRFFLAHPQGG